MKTNSRGNKGFRLLLTLVSMVGGLVLFLGLIYFIKGGSLIAKAAPIPPPEGYPKLTLSSMTVTPTLANTNGATLYYFIEIRNTGAYAALNTSLTDVIPVGATYNNDAQSSVPPDPTYSGGVLHWLGNVGFDASTFIQFSIDLTPGISGTIRNEAVISQSMISRPVTVTAVTTVTNRPILTVEKKSVPVMPGPEKPMTYTLVVSNQGQPAVNVPITVTDQVPDNTVVRSVGPGGFSDGSIITWTRQVTLDLGQKTWFTFSVNVDNVPSGTVISNENYRVASSVSEITAGKVQTVTVVDPIFSIAKRVFPDPPGSNREMTYTLTLLNEGSLATDLVITDSVPAGVEYLRGGSESGGIVTWGLEKLDTDQTAEFTYTVFISDVLGIPIINDHYGVCSLEGVCKAGMVITNVVGGPTFEATSVLDPIAKKPGGGGGPVTPTLTVRNLGPGNAIGAQAELEFGRISVQTGDLYAIIPPGITVTVPQGPGCGDKCVSYLWTGSLGVGDVVTFTTDVGQSTIGGDEGTHYTSTITVLDSLVNTNTVPISATAIGHITHFANLVPTKVAPTVIGRGQVMTYTINVWNSGLSTDEPPPPILTDTVPLSVTFLRASDGGVAYQVGGRTEVSWTLPAMSPGDMLQRSFSVLVNDDLISGTQIYNKDYKTTWFQILFSKFYSNTGQPVTTTVKEVGLIDSYKEVTPTLALPGPDILLTYRLHIVNSSDVALYGVSVYDFLPWEHTTYQRDAIASAGQVISDIVSTQWEGSVSGRSSEILTFTVRVDPFYEGAITNTAVITHPDLLRPVTITAVAYITTKPVLRITKTATPSPVERGGELLYTLQVVNLGQQATNLVIQDTIPSNGTYIENSASSGGQFSNGKVQWTSPVLKPGESQVFKFKVLVGRGQEIVNSDYWVTCEEGITDVGEPLVTKVIGHTFFLPILQK